MNNEEKEYKVYWSLQGICYVKGEDITEAVHKIYENDYEILKKDIGNPDATYTVNQVVEIKK